MNAYTRDNKKRKERKRAHAGIQTKTRRYIYTNTRIKKIIHPFIQTYNHTYTNERTLFHARKQTHAQKSNKQNKQTTIQGKHKRNTDTHIHINKQKHIHTGRHKQTNTRT